MEQAKAGNRERENERQHSRSTENLWCTSTPSSLRQAGIEGWRVSEIHWYVIEEKEPIK